MKQSQTQQHPQLINQVFILHNQLTNKHTNTFSLLHKHLIFDTHTFCNTGTETLKGLSPSEIPLNKLKWKVKLDQEHMEEFVLENERRTNIELH
jgi:hypothetical protein